MEKTKWDTVRAAVYARQSKARSDSSETSSEAQISAGEALAASRQWEVTHRFRDVGRSGWDPGAARPGLEGLMDAVRAGEVDVVVANELSRLTRQGAHDALLIDQELRKHGVRFVSVLEPFLDTSTPTGTAVFSLIAALAQQESDIKAERLKGAKDVIRAVGGRHSSAPPYGMRGRRERIGDLVVTVLEPDGDRPAHVAAVERMVAEAFAGRSDNSIAAALEADGVPAPGAASKRTAERRAVGADENGGTPVGTPVRWRAQTVRGILGHPAIGGFAVERVPRGPRGTLVHAIARDGAGAPLAPHTGIITGGQWLELQERRRERARPERGAGGSTVPQLLSGWRFFRCGVCGGPVGQTPGAYMCANPRGHGGLAIKRATADDHVARQVWARLSAAGAGGEADREWLAAAAARHSERHGPAGTEEARHEARAQWEHVRASIGGLQEDRRTGLYRGGEELAVWRTTMERYREFENRCRATLAELESRAAAGVRLPGAWLTPLRGSVDPLGPDTPWAGWDVYERRRFLGLFLDGVTVGPGRDRRTHAYIPVQERITLEWCGPASGTEGTYRTPERGATR
ncbi:recombinase family protein [Streptomyces sp. NPDC004111]|uniref:recombinase family protein n=1 Tax=Streptomyces sp. NPDC004111 TaxID=3364690 RepID=UPI0036B91072